MIPKKIYLRSEELEDNYMCGRMVSCDVAIGSCNAEYTDLSQVWHDASEIPTGGKPILIIHSDNTIETWKIPHVFESVLLFTAYEVKKWAYIDDLLPKK